MKAVPVCGWGNVYVMPVAVGEVPLERSVTSRLHRAVNYTRRILYVLFSSDRPTTL